MDEHGASSVQAAHRPGEQALGQPAGEARRTAARVADVTFVPAMERQVMVV